MAAPSSAAPDPFLSSLIYTSPVAESSRDVQPESLDEENMINKSSDEKVAERYDALSYVNLNVHIFPLKNLVHT